MKRLSLIPSVTIPVILLLSTPIMNSCRQKDLYLPDETDCIVEVEFIWDNAENASVEGMSTYFFPLYHGGKIWNFEIAGMEGGPISLPYGKYLLVALNNDSPGVDISSGVSPSSMLISARFIDETTMRPSGMIYGATMSNVHNYPDGMFYTSGGLMMASSEHRICVLPDSLATMYTIRLEDIREQEKIVIAYARLSGVATSLSLDPSKSTGESASLNISLKKSDYSMEGLTTGLGTPAGASNFSLTIYVELLDGRKVAKTFDVTSQVVKAPYPHNVVITLSGITFIDDDPNPPVPPIEDVGMDVDVDNWNNVQIDIITRH